MENEWRNSKLSEYVTLISGGTPSKSNPDYWHGTTPWISAKDMKSFRIEDSIDHLSELGVQEATRIIPPETVLILVRGMTLHNDIPICKTSLASAFNQDVKAVMPREGLLAPYLVYLLLANKPYLLSIVDSAGHGTGRLNTDTLLETPFLLPPLPTQKAIAHILGTLDDKIELLRQMNETLEAMARALFKSWFVDFDPVRKKAEGLQTGLPPEIDALFPDSLEDSELGEIPKGWTTDVLGNHFSISKGVSYKSEELAESDTALITLKSFNRGGGYRNDGLKSYTGKYKESQVILPGDVVMAFTDVTQAAEVIGRPAIVRSSSKYKNLVASLDVGIIRPKTSSLSTSFLYFLGNTDVFVAHTYSFTSGTTVLHLSKEALPSFQTVIPPKRIILIFSKFTETSMKSINQNEQQIDLLRMLKDSLLPKLISGDLEVKDIDKILEPST